MGADAQEESAAPDQHRYDQVGAVARFTHRRVPNGEANNQGPRKPVIAEMRENGLSSKTVDAYFKICRSIVAYPIDPATGNRLCDTRWNPPGCEKRCVRDRQAQRTSRRRIN